MSLYFVCDTCEKKYDATITLRGVKIDGHSIERNDSPCPECVEVSEQAKHEALEKRKKK